MGFTFTKTLTTRAYDLDWNRHTTSRTYEKFAYDARISVLEELGYPIETMLQKNIKYISESSFVRFLGQQFSNANLLVQTNVIRNFTGSFVWNQTILDESGKKACEIESISHLIRDGKKLVLEDLPEETHPSHNFTIRPKPKNQHTLDHEYRVPFSDMNCFWNLPADAVWKIFEEGRFLFFKEIIDFSTIQTTDTSTFFMGGEVKIFLLPEPGEKYTLQSWIESVEKIRFYFRQDIIDEKGKVFASMKDEQLFVSLSTSRPKRATESFKSTIEAFLEKQ